MIYKMGFPFIHFNREKTSIRRERKKRIGGSRFLNVIYRKTE